MYFLRDILSIKTVEAQSQASKLFKKSKTTENRLLLMPYQDISISPNRVHFLKYKFRGKDFFFSKHRKLSTKCSISSRKKKKNLGVILEGGEQVLLKRMRQRTATF